MPLDVSVKYYDLLFSFFYRNWIDDVGIDAEEKGIEWREFGLLVWDRKNWKKIWNRSRIHDDKEEYSP